MRYYIDPGTGSMLFAILIGIVGALNYLVRVGIVKLRFVLSGGKKTQLDGGEIPYVIFSDNKRYWNVFEPICREFDRRGIDVVYMTASPDDPALNCSYKHVKGQFIGKNNMAYAKLNFLKATVVLSTTPGLDVYQWKRSRDVKCYAHILHAAGEIILYRMFGIDYYDALLLSGRYQEADVRKLEKLRNLPEKEISIVGLPYMDGMAERLRNSEINNEKSSEISGIISSEKSSENNGEKNSETSSENSDETSSETSSENNSEIGSEQSAEISNEKNSEKNQKTGRTVLLAPSWGPSAILSRFGSGIIAKLLKTGYHIIIRPHPQSFDSEKEMMEKLHHEFPDSEQLEWNRDADNFEVLKRSDILISDFSGVVFDFALVYDKPVIYADTEFDRAPYDAWWLSDEIWTYTALPRIGMKLTQDKMGMLKEMIDNCLSDPGYAQGREEVRSETWEHFGEGARRTVDWLTAKYQQIINKSENENEDENVNKKANENDDENEDVNNNGNET